MPSKNSTNDKETQRNKEAKGIIYPFASLLMTKRLSILEQVRIYQFENWPNEVVGYQGGIFFDESKPNGTPVKRLDVSKISRLGWRAKTDFKAGIEKTYQWFKTLERYDKNS